jgi:hypothetical protein
MRAHPDFLSGRRRARTLVGVGAAQLAVSVALLLVASTTPARLPRWGGPLDGAVAFSLILTLVLLHRVAGGRVGPAALGASYRVATTLPAVVLVVLWVFRDRLIWKILLPGVAWRGFVLLSALPPCLAAGGGRIACARSARQIPVTSAGGERKVARELASQLAGAGVGTRGIAAGSAGVRPGICGVVGVPGSSGRFLKIRAWAVRFRPGPCKQHNN